MQRLAIALFAIALASCSTPAPELNPDGTPTLGKHAQHPATFASGTASPEGPRPFAYRTHVRPLIQSRCTLCHCPSLASRSGNLDLTSRQSALTTGRHAPVIIPGSAATSPFIQKITTTNPKGETVPLRGGPHSLSQRAINDLTRWIDEGADWTY
ncbi:MAG: hypothetical protein P8J87_14085 [Verrucomicrobiales bacterium]|nr:hypothetical protein [Verrucomicrobiales bacterium]